MINKNVGRDGVKMQIQICTMLSMLSIRNYSDKNEDDDKHTRQLSRLAHDKARNKNSGRTIYWRMSRSWEPSIFGGDLSCLITV